MIDPTGLFTGDELSCFLEGHISKSQQRLNKIEIFLMKKMLGQFGVKFPIGTQYLGVIGGGITGGLLGVLGEWVNPPTLSPATWPPGEDYKSTYNNLKQTN